MLVRWRHIDRQRNAIFLNGDLNLDAADLLAAIDATRKAARRRATESTIDDHRARFRSIPAGAPPGAAEPVEQPALQAEPGPAREQPIQCAEGDVAQHGSVRTRAKKAGMSNMPTNPAACRS